MCKKEGGIEGSIIDKFKSFFISIGFKSVNDAISGIVLLFVMAILLAIFFTVSHISMLTHGYLKLDIEQGKHFEYQFEYLSILFGCITVSISLATVFPYIITRLITTRKIEEIIQEKVLDQKENVITEAMEQLFEKNFPAERVDRLMRGDGDYARMVSYFLYSGKQFLWSIGWASRALNRYNKCDASVMCRRPYSEFEKQCIETIVCAISKFCIDKLSINRDVEKFDLRKAFFHDNREHESYRIMLRTFMSLLDYRNIRKKYFKINSNTDSTRYFESQDQKMIIDFFIAVMAWTLTPDEFATQSTIYYFETKEEFMDVINDTNYYNGGVIDTNQFVYFIETAKAYSEKCTSLTTLGKFNFS